MISISYANEIMERASQLPDEDILIEVAFEFVFNKMMVHSFGLLQYQKERANIHTAHIIDKALQYKENSEQH